jgi:hypothetical protein
MGGVQCPFLPTFRVAERLELAELHRTSQHRAAALNWRRTASSLPKLVLQGTLIFGVSNRQKSTQPRRTDFLLKGQERTGSCRFRATLWSGTIDPKATSPKVLGYVSNVPKAVIVLLLSDWKSLM